MKVTKILIIGFFLLSSISTFSRNKKVEITVSEQDAIIYANGKEMGTGSAIVIVPAYGQLTVIVKKVGFLTAKKIFYNMPNQPVPPKTYFFELQKDDAYEASIINDYANKDFEQEVNKKFSEDEAWKIISQIVTGYFDNLEMADKATGYMKTSWQSKSYIQQTIRTRIIVKQSSMDPLKYKIKIISEYSDMPNQSVKDDDKFKEWDRILRAYDGLITEFQTRLGGAF